MIPSNIRRTSRERGNIPLPMMVAGVLAVIVIAVCAWTLATMGSTPATEPVTADVPVKL